MKKIIKKYPKARLETCGQKKSKHCPSHKNGCLGMAKKNLGKVVPISEIYAEDVKEKIQNAQRRLKANENIKKPKVCPKCGKPLYIIDDRGGYCKEHYWIVPSDSEWISEFFEKELKKIFLEEFGDKLI